MSAQYEAAELGGGESGSSQVRDAEKDSEQSGPWSRRTQKRSSETGSADAV